MQNKQKISEDFDFGTTKKRWSLSTSFKCQSAEVLVSIEQYKEHLLFFADAEVHE